MKKRVLVCSEFTQLHTGYATLCKELLLSLKDKYEVAEFANYCDPIEHQGLIAKTPWRVYPNCPNKNNEQEVKIYNSDPLNVFGKWKFEHVINDFKPHIVIVCSDYWMASYINESPLRRFFNFVWMAPCDSYPQHEEWIDNFATCDGITTYTEWGKKILESQGIKVYGITSPGCDSKIQPLNKDEVKKHFGLNGKTIIGTVMRNQKRKLFPDLFEAFRKYLDKSNDASTFLYCHTSYPDVGFNIPKLLLEQGLGSKVLFTYRCTKCKKFFPAFFQGVCTQCIHCHDLSARFINVSNGVNTDELNIIYNLFDLYIQPCTFEGFGRPVIEAACCNIPIAATDFSATKDITDKITTAYKIKVLRTTLEQETERQIPTLSIDSIVDIFEQFCSLPKMLQAKLGYETGNLARSSYNWDKTKKVWESYIDSIDVNKYDALWKQTSQFHTPNFQMPKNLTTSQFVQWAIVNILGDTTKLGSWLEIKLTNQLNLGVISSNFLAGFTDDLSMFGKPQIMPFSREDCVKYLMNKVDKRNFWELKRNENSTSVTC